MYRKRNGSFGFSFSDFVQNAVPNMGMARSQYDWVPALGRDMLYAHQISSKQPGAPFGLDERSLFVGGICDSEGTSRKVFHRLGRVKILDDQGCVNTSIIEGKKFPHQVAILSQPRQKDLIGLLFWWEEECQRLRKLFDEEENVRHQIKLLSTQQGSGEGDETALLNEDELTELIDNLKFEREKLRMRIRQRPSQRRADIEEGTDQILRKVNTAPERMHRAQSMPSSTLDGGRNSHSEMPPAYYR